MFELNYEIKDIDIKTFYGVQNQYFNLIKSTFPTLKITGRDCYIFALKYPKSADFQPQKYNNLAL